jgi:hypothetical protein
MAHGARLIWLIRLIGLIGFAARLESLKAESSKLKAEGSKLKAQNKRLDRLGFVLTNLRTQELMSFPTSQLLSFPASHLLTFSPSQPPSFPAFQHLKKFSYFTPLPRA